MNILVCLDETREDGIQQFWLDALAGVGGVNLNIVSDLLISYPDASVLGVLQRIVYQIGYNLYGSVLVCIDVMLSVQRLVDQLDISRATQDEGVIHGLEQLIHTDRLEVEYHHVGFYLG